MTDKDAAERKVEDMEMTGKSGAAEGAEDMMVVDATVQKKMKSGTGKKWNKRTFRKRCRRLWRTWKSFTHSFRGRAGLGLVLATTAQSVRFMSEVNREWGIHARRRSKKLLPAGIFVRASEAQNDRLRATIVGPKYTA